MEESHGACGAIAGERPDTDSWPAVLRRAGCRAVLGVVAGLVLWSAAPLVIGWHSHAIVSGSMSPHVEPGDVVASSPLRGEEATGGQIILFDEPGSADRVVLHRVWSVNPDRTLVTKGDANADPDPEPVPVDRVRGLGRLLVPWAGYPLLWLREGRWVPVVATAGALSLLTVGAFGAGPRTTRRAVAAGVALVVVVVTAVSTARSGFTATTAASVSWNVTISGIVRNVFSYRCLMVVPDSRYGTWVFQHHCDRALPDRNWDFTTTEHGYVHLVNRATGTCLAFDSARSADGQQVSQFACTSGYADQEWRPVPHPSGRGHFLENRLTGRCLATGETEHWVGTKVFQQDCDHRHPYHQLWRVELA
ncbi:signal peptidase I [Saccharothrix obliqua]|uniref:signal peptidase I n=1 Tax=Saccharothrix obliqua TaxID=2861747 RepID=UPI001C5D3C6D|nr:signal peptidase I [Saccharothrix obliqua]MBW4718120.1 signal peptidase I [Saccharothrix obliqua]